jgi:hypothetical protein
VGRGDLRRRLSGRLTPAWLHDPVISEASSFNVPYKKQKAPSNRSKSIFTVSPVRIMLVTGTLLAVCGHTDSSLSDLKLVNEDAALCRLKPTRHAEACATVTGTVGARTRTGNSAN